MIIYKVTLISLFILIINGCGLNSIRTDSINRDERVNKISELRVKQIKNGDTFFTKDLKCLNNELQPFKDAGIKVSVNRIFDKTGKVYPNGSTAISDLVINAVSKLSAFYTLETPLVGDILHTRTNIMNDQYESVIGVKDNALSVLGRNTYLPVGIIFPTEYYISGALVQFDEGSVLPEESWGIDFDIDAVSLQKTVSTATVGLQLRLINSNTGAIVRNETTGRVASVLLVNRFLFSNVGLNFFRLINLKDYGLNYSVNVEDPKHYAVYEMIEKAIFLLFSTELNHKLSCAI